MRDGGVRKKRKLGVWRNRHKIEQPPVNPGKPAAIVNIEEGSVDKRVGPAEGDLEAWEVHHRVLGKGNEFPKAGESKLVSLFWSVGHKAQLLNRDVEKRIGMQPDEWKPGQGIAQAREVAGQQAGWKADAAQRKPPLARAPFRSVVSPVPHLRRLAQVLPDPTVRFGLFGGRVRQPPERVTYPRSDGAQPAPRWIVRLRRGR